MIHASAAALAQHISGTLKAPVLDWTGLTGYYDFDSKNILTDEDWRGNLDGTFLDAVKEMGFKLTPTTGPIETLVIDHIDERPSEN